MKLQKRYKKSKKKNKPIFGCPRYPIQVLLTVPVVFSYSKESNPGLCIIPIVMSFCFFQPGAVLQSLTFTLLIVLQILGQSFAESPSIWLSLLFPYHWFPIVYFYMNHIGWHMTPICHIIGCVKFGHLVQMLPARFLHYEVTPKSSSPFNNYFVKT